MIVCTTSFDVNTVLSLDGDVAGMKEYVKSLMPAIYQHNTALLSNQLYFINSKILKLKDVSIDKKASVSDTLVNGLQVCGYLDSFLEISTIERLVKEKRLYDMYNKDKERL